MHFWMSSRPLVYLGSVSFPIYVLHNPLGKKYKFMLRFSLACVYARTCIQSGHSILTGQVFYKKLVATEIFGEPMNKYPNFFYVYLTGVLLAAIIINHTVLTRAWWTNGIKSLIKWLNWIFIFRTTWKNEYFGEEKMILSCKPLACPAYQSKPTWGFHTPP